MQTNEFKQLKKRLIYLKGMLPSSSVSQSNLSVKDVDDISAFILLTHAACEQFMEKRALDTADAAKSGFDNGGTIGRVGKHLCVFPFLETPKSKPDFRKLSAVVGGGGFGVLLTKKFEQDNHQRVKDLLNIGYQRFKTYVDSNHGINLKHQFRLLSCIGLNVSDFDPTFASRIGQLAGARGEAAHTHVVAAAVQYSPSDLANWPADLINGFKYVDNKLTTLARRVN